MSADLKAVTTKLPSYLKAMLKEDCPVKLVYREVISNPLEKNDVLIVDSIQNMDESHLDLTGTPLETDLGDNTSFNDSILLQEGPICWSAQEAGYCPLTLNEARKFINSELRLKRPDDNFKRLIYCICDGSDARRTVILGSEVAKNKFATTMVYILPCCEEHEIMSLEYMKKDHLNNFRGHSNIKVKCYETWCYYLHGYNLINISNLKNVSVTGSIAIEELNNGSSEKNKSQIKMHLQAIVGHINSHLNSYWNELCLIRSYIEILANSQSSEYVELSDNYLDNLKITEMLNELFEFQNVNYKKQAGTKALNLNELRDCSVLDKLWAILKYCKTLSDLRDCLHLFFEELTNTDARFVIFDEVNSNIAKIIIGISDGKYAVPTLSFSQSLEYFIELGFEKLLNDYITIITSFYPYSRESILKQWKHFSEETEIANSNQISKRRTRISFNLKASVDVTNSQLKLAFLSAMHTVAEFMFLFKEHTRFTDEVFDSFCETICTKYITNFVRGKHTLMPKNNALVEFTFNLHKMDPVVIQEKQPTSYCVNMYSCHGSSELRTVLYFSENPIFPPVIYEDYNINLDTSEKKLYYAAKLETSVENS